MPTITATPLTALQNNELEREFELDVRVSLMPTFPTTVSPNTASIHCTTTADCTDTCTMTCTCTFGCN